MFTKETLNSLMWKLSHMEKSYFQIVDQIYFICLKDIGKFKQSWLELIPNIIFAMKQDML